MNLYSTFIFLHPFAVPAWPGLAAVNVFALSPGRLGAITAALLGLVGVIVSMAAFRRQKAGIGTGRRGAIVALTTGPAAILLGSFVVATSTGGIGTGNGRGGAYVAVVLGLAALGFGWQALTRSHRSRHGNHRPES
jgi:uncharacterized YccA/Bax inhibitor family protein